MIELRTINDKRCAVQYLDDELNPVEPAASTVQRIRFLDSGDVVYLINAQETIAKANPYHDAEGKFTSKDNAVAPLGDVVHGNEVDALSYDENRARLAELVDRYKQDADFRGAVEVVSKYVQVNQPVALATRAIVESALKGKSVADIMADKRIAALVAAANDGVITPYMSEKTVRTLVEGAAGYYRTLSRVPTTKDTLYRGAKTGKNLTAGKEFELVGPTAISHSKDVAMTYSGGVLYRIRPGAKALPSRALQAVKRAAEGDDYSTLPAFYRRSDSKVHPRGPGAGFRIDMDTDRELTTSGRFRVVSTEKTAIEFTSEITGRPARRTVTVVEIEQVGVLE